MIRLIERKEKNLIKEVAKIHYETFDGFFLTFMGKGFLYQLYLSFSSHQESGLYVAFDDNNYPIGFLAYSYNLSELYKYMLKTRFFQFAWFSFLAFIKKPIIFVRLLRAFLKPKESKREENYAELSSIGVKTDQKSKGVGSQLIKKFIDDVDFTKYRYISLETDALSNDKANKFYVKMGFKLFKTYETKEGRIMNEYRLYSNNSL